MTNKEWLKMVKQSDEENLKNADMVLFIDEMNTTNELNYRQVKAMEIIAEEMIKLRKSFEPNIKITKREGDKLL
jgi:hypothetical protein